MFKMIIITPSLKTTKKIKQGDVVLKPTEEIKWKPKK